MLRFAFWKLHLDILFKRAIRTHTDPAPDAKNIKNRHRYHAPFLNAGEVILAKLTVNEFKEASDGIRIYSVESIDIAKPAGFRASSISENRRNYNPLAGFEDKLEARIAEVNPKDGAFSIGDRAYTTVAQEIAAL